MEAALIGVAWASVLVLVFLLPKAMRWLVAVLGIAVFVGLVLLGGEVGMAMVTALIVLLLVVTLLLYWVL